MTSINRHSGAGRNPVHLPNMQLGFVRCAELFYSLDSGLRRITSHLHGFIVLSGLASSFTNDEVLNLAEKKSGMTRF